MEPSSNYSLVAGTLRTSVASGRTEDGKKVRSGKSKQRIQLSLQNKDDTLKEVNDKMHLISGRSFDPREGVPKGHVYLFLKSDTGSGESLDLAASIKSLSKRLNVSKKVIAQQNAAGTLESFIEGRLKDQLKDKIPSRPAEKPAAKETRGWQPSKEPSPQEAKDFSLSSQRAEEKMRASIKKDPENVGKIDFDQMSEEAQSRILDTVKATPWAFVHVPSHMIEKHLRKEAIDALKNPH